MESFTLKIRQDPNITGVKVEKEEFKLKSYVDDIALTISHPQKSIQYVIEQTENFGSYSGFNMGFNMRKTDTIPKFWTKQKDYIKTIT